MPTGWHARKVRTTHSPSHVAHLTPPLPSSITGDGTASTPEPPSHRDVDMEFGILYAATERIQHKEDVVDYFCGAAMIAHLYGEKVTMCAGA